jgi:hypothetical protein
MSNNFRISEVCQIFWKRFRISEKTSENLMANFGSDWSFWDIDSHCHMNTTKETHWFTNQPSQIMRKIGSSTMLSTRYGSKDAIWVLMLSPAATPTRVLPVECRQHFPLNVGGVWLLSGRRLVWDVVV